MKMPRLTLNRSVLERAAHRWVWALAGMLLGLGSVLGWAADVLAQHQQLHSQVQALKVNARPRSPTVPDSPVASDGVDRLPDVTSASHLGLALQSGLAQQGLHVLSLRSQGLHTAVPLPSQVLALRLQGRFSDFTRVWTSLVDAGPVWTLDRLSVVASGQTGQWLWDGVWRAWLRSDSATGQAWPAGWVPASGSHALGEIDPLEGGAWARLSPALAASDVTATLLPADPRQWPVSSIRLVGVWQQGGNAQAVLTAGPHWAVLGPGASLALEGYRLQAVRPASVELQPLKGSGGTHIMQMEGEQR